MGPVFHGRWGAMRTCLCLPELSERSEQLSGDFGIARLEGVAALNASCTDGPSDVTRVDGG